MQYTIKDPKTYVLSYAEPDQVLQQLVEAVITTTMARSQIDSETFLKRALLQQRIIQQLRVDLDAAQLGIQVVVLSFGELSAPSAVVDAFNEVSSARGDKDTMILSAQSYASKHIPDTRGQATGKIEAAHGLAAQIRSEASIRTAHFRSLLDSYKKNPKPSEASCDRKAGKTLPVPPRSCSLPQTRKWFSVTHLSCTRNLKSPSHIGIKSTLKSRFNVVPKALDFKMSP